MVEKHQILQDAEEFYFPGNHVGVLVSHGFTGTTQSVYSLGEGLAKQGYTVYGPRLTGHGTHYEDMEEATYHDWILDVEKGLMKLKETCSIIFVTGLSMGGTLTLYLAENHQEIAGIIPINAAIELAEMEQYYSTIKDGDQRFTPGIGSDIKAEGIKELAYDQTPVKSMGELIQLKTIVRDNLAKIKTPTLILHSTVDHVVPPENSKTIYEQINAQTKDIVPLKNSYHVATLDNDKDFIIEQCQTFIEKIVKEK